MGKLTTRRRGAVWAVVLMTAAACTPPESDSDERSDAPSTSSAPSAASASPTQQAGAPTPPELDAGMGETLAGQRAATRGNASLEYSGGAEGKALIVAVSCKGDGSITVRVPVVKMSFPLQCSVGEPAVTYNQFALSAADKPGTVSVTAPPTVTWAVTVGRGDPASEDAPSTG
ncbi:hypothetical protein SSP24_76590 [Streptomyces spinoverrucosus]|uniref:Lipoprotein n=1 Tax=Streptomyces spinoverrucosus TaxID=284043 RepID=A0A4Y3VSR9_9ACTN|nr:hypothetical protein [Streptomyces spinoverrucosus]GEC10004.1 hypothetical protein SSP24_76590 [Streptomyces spinoverrucosus]GHB75217.1 hypothetical protein GCM10010397_51970 [Streptomyces spinoverrucosus]